MWHSQCGIASCANEASPKGAGHICRRHWARLPQDIRARVRWAVDGEDEIELMAALASATDFVA